VHDVNNLYNWSATASAADGTLFTDFLATLNSDSSASIALTCFANHCDWRIPNVVELVYFSEGSVASNLKIGAAYARAVRGGH